MPVNAVGMEQIAVALLPIHVIVVRVLAGLVNGPKVHVRLGRLLQLVFRLQLLSHPLLSLSLIHI